jgi:hypothetical protein
MDGKVAIVTGGSCGIGAAIDRSSAWGLLPEEDIVIGALAASGRRRLRRSAPLVAAPNGLPPIWCRRGSSSTAATASTGSTTPPTS